MERLRPEQKPWEKSYEAWTIAEDMHGNVERTGGTRIDPDMGRNFVEAANVAIIELEEYSDFLALQKNRDEDEFERVQRSINDLKNEVDMVEKEIE